ncbi:MAG TPA: porin [Albitalea sp.]|nr:porin [Albitalea sp.]
MCTPAFADEVSDLKAEIAAQRQSAEAQKARLDALEQRLGAAQAQPAPAAGASYTQGEGLSYKSPKLSVTLYGLIDLTASTINHANAAGDRLTSFQTAWFSGNRWGITGKRDLSAGGLNAIFKLESEFVTHTGEMDTPGVLFNRDAWVGFESADLGKLTLGRQNALGRDFAAGYLDPYGSAKASTEEGGGTNTNNFKHLIFYGGSATGTRMNNGVVWKKVFSNNLVAGLAYQFGGIAGDFSKGSTKSAALGYNGGPFNVAGFVTQANVNGFTHKSYSVGGNYQLGEVRLNAGAFRYTAEQGALGSRTDNAYTVSAKFAPAGKMDYELGAQRMDASNAAVNAGGNVLNAYANASTATATATGKKGTVYGSIFYHFDKSTEVYLAGDYMKLGGGYRVATANGFRSQTELAVGLRTRF